jgi:hypothetical protein
LPPACGLAVFISPALPASVCIKLSNLQHHVFHRYVERLILDKAVTIVGDADNPAAVELCWETTEPYQPAIYCAANGIVVRGLTIRHRSPSIANNYAVQMQVVLASWMCGRSFVALLAFAGWRPALRPA